MFLLVGVASLPAEIAVRFLSAQVVQHAACLAYAPLLASHRLPGLVSAYALLLAQQLLLCLASAYVSVPAPDLGLEFVQSAAHAENVFDVASSSVVRQDVVFAFQ